MTVVALRSGLIVDGSGRPPYRGDVVFEDGTLTAVGDAGSVRVDHERDIGGLIVAPGFVDIHSHSDLSILGHPAGTSKVLQGVTTEVVGNCGLSVAPVSSLEVAAQLRPLMSYCNDASVTWDWTGVDGYLERVREARPLPRIAILAGHNTIRGSVVGLADRKADSSEIRSMQQMLAESLKAGAVGMSLGLMYPPSYYATEEELTALAGTLAEHDALLACHLADYSDGLLDAVAHMIRVSELSGCRLQISHLAVVGRKNWGAVASALDLVDAAVARGVDVAVDFYPYLAGSTNLSQLVPAWALEGGLEALRERLARPVDRASVLEHLDRRTLTWDEVLLASVPAAPALEGKRISEAAAIEGMDARDLVVRLLESDDPTIVAFGRSEDDLRSVLVHPRSVLGSDGLAVNTFGTVGGPVPHPRFFGAFPALFERYVREEPLLTIEEAVRKCTSAPADRVRMHDRGRLEPGLRADLVVFDRETIADRSTYADSRKVPAGIHSVVIGGVEAARDGEIVRAP